LSRDNNQKWDDDSEYVQIFTRIWNVVYDHYVEAIKKHANAFLESPAGVRFKQHLAKSKRAKHAATELSSITLCKFEGLDGINWGTPELSEFWQALCQVANPGDLETSLHPLSKL